MHDYADWESGRRKLQHSDGSPMKLTKWPALPAYKTRFPEERDSIGKLPKVSQDRKICNELNAAFRRNLRFRQTARGIVPQYLNGIRLPECMMAQRSTEPSEREKHAKSYELKASEVRCRDGAAMTPLTCTTNGLRQPNVVVPRPVTSEVKHVVGCLGRGRCACLAQPTGKIARSDRYVVLENPPRMDDIEVVRARTGSRLVRRVPLPPVEAHLEDAIAQIMTSGGF